MPAGRPLKFESPEKLQEKIDAYFSECEEKGQIPTITGLAVALDTSRKVLVDYESKDEFSNTIKRAKSKVEANIEQLALSGKTNPAFTIFNFKNNFGWKDKTEFEGDIRLPQPILGGASVQTDSDDQEAPTT